MYQSYKAITCKTANDLIATIIQLKRKRRYIKTSAESNNELDIR